MKNKPLLTLNSIQTGNAPGAWVDPCFGGRADFGRLSDWQHSGCLHAPNLIAAGSMWNKNVDDAPHPSFIERT